VTSVKDEPVAVKGGAAGAGGEEESKMEAQETGAVAAAIVVAAIVAVQVRKTMVGVTVGGRRVVVSIVGQEVTIPSGGFSTQWCAAASFRGLTIPNVS